MIAKLPDFDVMTFLKEKNTGMPVATYQESQAVFAQGDPANAVFYVHRGQVKVTVISERGKEAVVAIRGYG
jgi:CRP-like cAMP-binding protein